MTTPNAPKDVTKDSVLTGLIGRGIALSRTPAMHMAEARAQGINGVYRILDMDAPERANTSLKELIEQAEILGYDGFNVTYPYKIEVIEHLDELSDNARAVGAVNTVVLKDGKRYGHNTDLWGFAESFRRGLPDAKRDHALLIGAGGAGVAVAHALVDCGVKVLSITDTDPARAESLAAQVRANRPNCTTRAVTDVAALVNEDRTEDRLDGIINATPVGMAKLPGTSFPVDLIDPVMWVADIVYFPLETELLSAARAKGCAVLPGSGMAVFQAVRAFELFTGLPASPERMKARFDAFDEVPQAQAS
ncbi:shikimate dehydrogenase [Celeribacter sp. PS-C1]|uniref:shikimate dehydrogenase n=1 Tax=Celeribacter sp. PS-C1 TaxID=2820813 RepID=UPI001CA52358|nr:shikimate dehydrogenase [Celeribacter sp. PS-C1]MBW6418827.1 shikimate dehydrogenase [Celeribacter sp. PS-C1]